ncbi:MAG: hypothetical protein Q8R37_00740 [Nanoarchaeota archaeon]|nr:hypothetical protein [Nanoarchaeota archaeon]
MNTRLQDLINTVQKDKSDSNWSVLADKLQEEGNLHGEALANYLGLKQEKLEGKAKEDAEAFLKQMREKITTKYELGMQSDYGWYGAFLTLLPYGITSQESDKKLMDQFLQSLDGQFTKLIMVLDLNHVVDFETLLADYGDRFMGLDMVNATDNDITSLAKSTVPNLKDLQILHGAALNSSAYVDLCNSDVMKNLYHLVIRNKNMTDADVKIVAYSPNVQKLRCLNLIENNTLSNQSVQELVHSNYLKKLKSLRLTHTQITDSGADLLMRSAVFPDLEQLEFSRNYSITSHSYRSLQSWADTRGINLTL